MTRHLNPKKLLLSKWTAVSLQQQEKHFLVTQIANNSTPLEERDLIVLEAVMSKNAYRIDWHQLLDEATWRQGWH